MIFISIKLTQYLRKRRLQNFRRTFLWDRSDKKFIGTTKGNLNFPEKERNSMSCGPAVESCVVHKTELACYTTN